MLLHDATSRRRGVVVPLVALLMTVLLGMVAFAVDIGYIAVTKTELQAVADSSALAACSELLDRSALTGSPNQTAEIAAARDKAVAMAALHKAGAVTIVLDRNDSNSADGDIVIGKLSDPSDPASTTTYSSAGDNDTARVKARRSAVRNGSLSLFFGPVLNKSSVDLDATCTVSFRRKIKGFKIPSGSSVNPKLLPYALDINVWTDKVVNGNGDDDWAYNPTTRAYYAGSDGIPEVKLFPNKGISPGNFGTIDIGSASNGTNELARQILYGPNASDLAHYPNGEFKLGSDGTLVTEGDTGISAGVKDELASIRGQPRVIPLYRPPITYQGNTAQFTIVGFAGIIITEVDLTGSNSSKHITIQPEFVIDTTVIPGTETWVMDRYVYGPPMIIR